jgi:hypothetical protein
MSYKGGCRSEFGIIGNIDKTKDYGAEYLPEFYHCVAICDDALDDWWEELTKVKTFYHCMDRPSTAFARYGVTLIPPESLDTLIEIIGAKTRAEFMDDALEIIEMMKRAKSEHKFIINYGV